MGGALSRPGYFVTALLYRPKQIDGKRPGVISPCGHSSEGKAAGSAFTGRDSATFAAMAQNAPAVLATIAARLQGQRFAPHQGAVAVKDAAGNIVGAVGVSGATSDEDEAIARAGAAAYEG